MPEVQLTRLQLYCNALYNHFDEDAVNIESGDSVFRVWKGFVTSSAAKVGIPDGVYRRVIVRLEDLKCIEVIEQGKRNQPSTVVLLRPPTPEIWAKPSELALTKPAPSAKMVAQDMENLKKSLGGIDVLGAFRAIDAKFGEIEVRLSALENKESMT